MKSKSIYKYIYFGTALRYLQDAKEGHPIKGDGRILLNLNTFLSCLEEFHLPVTQRAAGELMSFKDEIKKLEGSLTEEQASNLGTIMTDLRKTLFAEASGNIAYIVVDKRIDVNKLLSGVSSLMAPGVFDKLPTIAKYDFEEAGKCIAFERPTAAAFHILRGTESVLRKYYCSIVKRNRVDPLLWGPMVESLKRRRNPLTTLLNHLDHIREDYRNPTQHPEKIYDIEEVQELFNLCIEAVTRMAASFLS